MSNTQILPLGSLGSWATFQVFAWAMQIRETPWLRCCPAGTHESPRGTYSFVHSTAVRNIQLKMYTTWILLNISRKGSQVAPNWHLYSWQLQYLSIICSAFHCNACIIGHYSKQGLDNDLPRRRSDSSLLIFWTPADLILLLHAQVWDETPKLCDVIGM